MFHRYSFSGMQVASERACLGRGVCSINSKKYQQYLYHYLILHEDNWASVVQGSTFESINGNEIKKMKINIPSSEVEIKKISNILTKFEKNINLYEQELEAIKLQKKGLMQLLLTGIVRVQC